MNDCYVERPRKEEAIEIVDRAVANGVECFESVDGMDVIPASDFYRYDLCDVWGVCKERGTFTYDIDGDWCRSATKLTMDEYRAKFPCEKYDGKKLGVINIGEIMELIEDTDFFSAHTGESTTLEAGHKVVVAGIATRYDNGKKCAVVQSTTNTSCGFCVLNPEYLCSIKSDRERFIESALATKSAHMLTETECLGALYDAGFKAPENNNENT